jgi:hypothetical protein
MYLVEESITPGSDTAPTIHSTTYNSRKIYIYFYSTMNNNKEWRCRKCEQLKSKNGGWTNLLLHLKSYVGKDYALQYVQHADSMRAQQHHASLIGVDRNSASAATNVNSYVLLLGDAEKEMAEWQ